jgi:hypothetical protein
LTGLRRNRFRPTALQPLLASLVASRLSRLGLTLPAAALLFARLRLALPAAATAAWEAALLAGLLLLAAALLTGLLLAAALLAGLLLAAALLTAVLACVMTHRSS